MPLYEYECTHCRQRFERIQKFSDPPVETCPSCGGRVSRLLSAPAVQFRGSGWYTTDYARKSSPGEKSEGEAKADDPAAKLKGSDKSEKKESSPAKKPSDH